MTDTHYACNEVLARDGGKASCCYCTGHECEKEYMSKPLHQQPNDNELTKKIYEVMQISYLSERHDAILALIQDEILKARVAMLNETIHQSGTNLKTSEAVAQWAEMRIATLSNQLKTKEER